MYILTFYQGDYEYPWLCFDTIEDGRAFLSKINGYEFTMDEEGFESEWININTLPDYQEIEYKGNKVPISRFMFKSIDIVELFFFERINLSIPNQGLIQGTTEIDAYSIPNEEVQSYVETREKMYDLVKTILEEKGMQVERAYHGSEDGEAIIYKRSNESDWHLLWHLDPSFINIYNEGEEKVRHIVNSYLD